LQNAKPKLDVLGVVVLILWFRNHYYSYVNYFFKNLNHLVSLFLFAFLFILHWLFNLWLYFSTLQWINFFKMCVSFELLGWFQYWCASGLHWSSSSIHGIFMEYFVVHATW
jgi:hypothetical protein